MEFSITFIKILLLGLLLVSPVLLMLGAIISILGLIVGRIESWRKFDALYWAFITALTVGYGDILPLKKISKVLSIIITFIGLMLAGILVAITVEAASNAFKAHTAPNEIEHLLKNVE
ncbi:potassium channel family protein [Marinobacter sp.]|uniref:potassium channel family protein n=1 Tax=Marinobacter sp. TaxID=50741 RepID=UPI003A94B6CD